MKSLVNLVKGLGRASSKGLEDNLGQDNLVQNSKPASPTTTETEGNRAISSKSDFKRPDRHADGANTAIGKFSDDSAYIGSDDPRTSLGTNHSSVSTAGASLPIDSYENEIHLPPSFSSSLTTIKGDGDSSLAALSELRCASDGFNTDGTATDSGTNGATDSYTATRRSRDRLSRESGRSGDTFSSGRSRRSSFAIERASFESNRASLDIFKRCPQPAAPLPQIQTVGRENLCRALNLPENLWQRFIALAVIPADTPVPMPMLTKLWSLNGEAEAEGSANLLTQLGVMKVAALSDGTTWALVQPSHLKALHELPSDDMTPVHRRLIEAYRDPALVSLADVVDDGYIMQNVGHHLVHMHNLEDLKKLLMRPSWLETKLHSYGVASVVSDFRRYLMVEHDDGIKLLLEAFQMSVSACLAHPGVGMLNEQIAGRLQLVWSTTQVHLDSRPLSCVDQGKKSSLASLKTCTPSLEQAGGLQRMTLRGHTGGVKKVLITPGGIDVVTGSTDGTSRVWDMEIGDCVLLLDGHTGPVLDLAISVDGTAVATASEDGTARVWDMEEGNCLNVLVGHSGPVNSVAIDNYGKIAITAGADGTGRVWNISTGSCLQLLLGHTSLGALHKVILTKDGTKAITCSSDFTARIWEVMTGQCIHVLSGHSGWVVDAALTSNSTILVTASHDGTARVWSMLDGRCIHVLGGHDGRINAIRISPNNKFAITVSDDFTAQMYDLQSGKCKHKLEGHGGWLSDCAITPSNDKAITSSGDDLAVVWDLVSGSCQNVLEGHSDEVLSVQLTRKGRFAVTGSMDGTARIWDLQAQSAHLQKAHTGRVHGLVANSDFSTVISFGDDGCLMWSTADKTCKGHLAGPAVRWAACLDNGNQLLCASGDRTTDLWDLKTSTSTTALPGSKGSRVKSWSVSDDGQVAAVVLFDSTVTVWDLNTQEPLSVLQRWGQRDAASGHTGGVNAATVTHDGARVLTVSKDCTARLWDVQSGQTIHVMRGHLDGITAAVISKDDCLAVTLAYDNTARLWDLHSGACVGIMQHNNAVTRAVFSNDGKTLITASADHLAFLWRCETGQRPVPRFALKGHTEEVMGVAISEDGNWAATCARDCSLRLWNTKTGVLDGFFASDAGLTCCLFANTTLIAGDDSGILHLLALPHSSSADK